MNLRRALAILTLATAGTLGTITAAHSDDAPTDSGTTVVVEGTTGTDDSAWGTPPAEEPAPEPTGDGPDATTADDSAWG
jgi:hypothetical protein